MYARKYALADFIEPSDTIEHGRQLLPSTDSDDDAASPARPRDVFRGSVSSARPPLMTPADLSFVKSVGPVLSK